MTCLISSNAASRSIGVLDNQYARSSDLSWRFETTTADRSTFATSTSFITQSYSIAAISDNRLPLPTNPISRFTVSFAVTSPKFEIRNYSVTRPSGKNSFRNFLSLLSRRGHQTSINPTPPPRRKIRNSKSEIRNSYLPPPKRGQNTSINPTPPRAGN